MQKNWLLSAAFIICIPTSTFAGTISEAIHAALEHHPEVKIATASKNIAAQQKREEQSAYFPEISLSVAGGRVFGNNATSRGINTVTRDSAYSGYFEGSAALNQPIYDGLETKNRVSAAEARRLSAQETILDVKEELALRAANAYINVVRNHAILDFLRKHKRKLESYKNKINKAVEAGGSDFSEAGQARITVLQFQSNITLYENELIRAEAEYKEVIGEKPEKDVFKPLPKMPDIISQAAFEEALPGLIENHPRVSSLFYEAKAAKEDMDAETASLLPNLNTELSFREIDQREEIGGEVTDARAILRLNWDFQTGGGQFARVKRAKFEKEEAEARKELEALTIRRELETARKIIDNARAEKDLAEKRYKTTIRLKNTERKRYEGGRIRLLQLMNAENALVNRKIDQINSEYDFISAQYQFLATAGQLLKSLAEAPKPTKMEEG